MLGQIQDPFGDSDLASNLRSLTPQIGIEAPDTPGLLGCPEGQFSLPDLKPVHQDGQETLKDARPAFPHPELLREIDNRTPDNHGPDGKFPREEEAGIRIELDNVDLRKWNRLRAFHNDITQLKRGEERT